MFKTIKREIKNVHQKDPACNSSWEILFCYPGVQAVLAHRFLHFWWQRADSIKIIGCCAKSWLKFFGFLVRFVTGIEIHPAAQIGEKFFIDHGMGVVIGETTIIGDNVTLYQGVTLGGTSTKKEKRHPTLGNNIIVGAGAKILGNISIGDYVQVGSNAVVVKDVPSHSTVVGIPGRIVKMNGDCVSAIENLDHNLAPDVLGKAIQELEARLEALEK